MSETDGPYKATSFRRRGHECSTWGVEGPGVKVMDENWSRAAAEREATSFNAAWRAALEWAAGQVEAAGCCCPEILHASESEPGVYGFGGRTDPVWTSSNRKIVEHDPRCPVALAAKIREGAP